LLGSIDEQQKSFEDRKDLNTHRLFDITEIKG